MCLKMNLFRAFVGGKKRNENSYHQSRRPLERHHNNDTNVEQRNGFFLSGLSRFTSLDWKYPRGFL